MLALANLLSLDERKVAIKERQSNAAANFLQQELHRKMPPISGSSRISLSLGSYCCAFLQR
jgi:hypothetical protein